MSESISFRGLFYREATLKQALFGRYSTDQRPLYLAHNGVRERNTFSVISSFRADEDPSSGGPRAWTIAGYCNESGGLPRDANVEIIGEANLDNERAYLVCTTWKDGVIRLDMISKDTLLPLRREVPGAFIERYRDYRKVDGVSVPFDVTLTDNSATETHLSITSAKFLDREMHWAYYPQAWPTPKTSK